MIIQMERAPSTTSRERAQQLYNKNIELEKKRQKSLQAKVPSDPNAWFQIRENYESIILEDHAFSEQNSIEFALWQLHYKRIDEFRAHLSAPQASIHSSGRGPPSVDRSTKIRVQFKAFLSEATGFYHDLILKIRAKYGVPLGHFTDEDDLALIGTNNTKSTNVKKALVSCHRCLVYLGDLARYKGLYGESESRPREYSAASSYYMQAASLWPSNGNPHHQLAILATYSGDEMVAIYWYFRSLAAQIPFLTAKDNLVVAFEKNRQSHTHLLEAKKISGDRKISTKEKFKEFCNQFVRLHGIIFSRTSLDSFPNVLSSVIDALHELLSSGPKDDHNFGTDNIENGLAILRITSILIFTVNNVHKKNEGHSYAEILQQTVLYENACTIAFEVMSLFVERCLQLNDPSSSFLLPGILVFLEWLACCPDVVASIGTSDGKKHSVAKLIFWKNCLAFFNKLLLSQVVPFDDDGDEPCFTNMGKYEEGGTESQFALWEDFELRGFSPLIPSQNILDYSRKCLISDGVNNREKGTRVKRIIASGKALACVAMVDGKQVYFDSKVKRFVIGIEPRVSSDTLRGPHFELFEDSNAMLMPGNVRSLLEGEDDDEEIVFKPAFIEKTMDADSECKNASQMKDFRKPPLLVGQHASLADGIKNLRFVENGNVLTSESKGGGGSSGLDGGSHLLPRGVGHAIFQPVLDNIHVKQPSISSTTLKSQMGRPIRHVGPPPGFNPARPKHVAAPGSNIFGVNGSLLQMNQIYASNGMGPYYGGNPQFMSNANISHGNISLPFPGGNQSTHQDEHYHGGPTWTAQYRV